MISCISWSHWTQVKLPLELLNFMNSMKLWRNSKIKRSIYHLLVLHAKPAWVQIRSISQYHHKQGIMFILGFLKANCNQSLVIQKWHPKPMLFPMILPMLSSGILPILFMCMLTVTLAKFMMKSSMRPASNVFYVHKGA